MRNFGKRMESDGNQLRHARLSFVLHMRVKAWVGMNLLHVSQ